MTSKEIAQLAGVSVGTVDRVIHKRPGVSRATRERVEALLQQHNYRPNPLAKQLVKRDKGRICAFLPIGTEGGYWHQALHGVNDMQENLAEFGLELRSFFYQQEDGEQTAHSWARLMEAKPSAVVLPPLHSPHLAECLRQLDAAEIPYVAVDEFQAKSGALTVVGTKNYVSGRMAGRLLSLGMPAHSTYHLVVIEPEHHNQGPILLRQQGFESYMTDHQPEAKVVRTTVKPEGLADWVGTTVRPSAQRPTGLLVTHSRGHLLAEVMAHYPKEAFRMMSYDVTAANSKQLREGTIDFLLDQHPRKQTAQAVQLLFDHLVLHKQVPSEVRSQPEIICAENLAIEPK